MEFGNVPPFMGYGSVGVDGPIAFKTQERSSVTTRGRGILAFVFGDSVHQRAPKVIDNFRPEKQRFGLAFVFPNS